MKNLFFITLVLLVVLQVGCEKKSSGDSADTAKKAPDFTLTDHNGNKVSLSDYRDKIVVLEWFNFECPFVKYHYEQAGTMTTLANKYKDKNVVWLAINSTAHTTSEQDKKFANEHKLSYPILEDRSGVTGRAYRALTSPHMFIVDEKGLIVYEGAIDNAPFGKSEQEPVNYVDRALAELTSAKPVSIPKTKPYGCSVKYAN